MRSIGGGLERRDVVKGYYDDASKEQAKEASRERWIGNIIAVVLFTAMLSGIPLAIWTNNGQWLWTLALIVFVLS
jgi:hypothetical protein